MKHYKNRVNDLLQVVINEAKKLNIPISDNICSEVVINYRAKKRFGACKTKIINNKKHFQIEIGSALSICEEDIIKNTLMHEILHTCEGCSNHGKLWKSYADKANDVYGYGIKRTSSFSEMGICDYIEKREAKYAIICKKCGSISYRMRKSEVVNNPHEYRCKCGGALIVKKIMKE